MRRRLSVVLFCGVLVLLFSSAASAGRRRGPHRLVETAEYKEGDFARGIIEDYSDMVEGDGVEWVYVAPGVRLSEYRIDVGRFKNASKVGSKAMLAAAEVAFTDELEQRLSSAGKQGTLTTENAIYWAERSSEGKRWIPYAGFHLAQAGVGVEMIFRDADGNVVAKIRHSTREGDRLEGAAEEVAADVVSFIEEH